MIFGFGKTERVASEEFGSGLWMFCGKFSKGFYEQFKPQIENAGFHLFENQEIELSREIAIINLWIISKVLARDQKVLDVLHRIFISGHRNLAESEQEKTTMARLAQENLNNRFKDYYDNWRDGSENQTLLSICMLEYMINKGRPDQRLTNALLTAALNAHILFMMKSVLDFRKGFKISD